MVETNTEVQDKDHRAMENPVESTLTMGNTTYKIIHPHITGQHYQNQPALTKRSTADTTTRSYDK